MKNLSQYISESLIKKHAKNNEKSSTFVDLGLPSGILWANRNIGSHSKYDFGDKYAWGELKSKEKYTLENYKFYNKNIHGLNKYPSNSLEEKDDIVFQKTSGECQIPGHTDLRELIYYTKPEYDKKHKCLILHSTRNENSIVFPYNGKDKDLMYRNAYWLADLNPAYPDNGYFFKITHDKTKLDWGNSYRYQGFYLRPIKKPNN